MVSDVMHSFIKSGVPRYGNETPFMVDKYEAIRWWGDERNEVSIVVNNGSDIPHALVTLWQYIDNELMIAERDHKKDCVRIKQEQIDEGYPDLNVFTMHDNYQSFGLFPSLIVMEDLKPITDTLPDSFDVYIIMKTREQRLVDELTEIANNEIYAARIAGGN